jgi:hypothetical protein
MIEIMVTGFVRDEGTLVLLSGLTVHADQERVFAVEHRYAADIMQAVEAGEEPVVAVPEYMVWAP